MWRLAGLNQLVQQGPTALTHDAKGNTTSIGSTAYQYSQLDHLFGFASGYMMYDGLGRLDYATGPTGTRYLEWSGNRLIGEYVAGVGNKRYVHGPSTGSGGVDEPLLWYEGDTLTDKRYVHADERGSIIAVSNAGGTPFRINTYDEYGNPAATNAGTFGYTGQTWLPELGQWYYKARVMNPRTGRFMQADPIGYQAGMNLYAYVSGDPVNLVDPLGLKSDPDGDGCAGTQGVEYDSCGKRPKPNVSLHDWGGGGGGWSLPPNPFAGGGIFGPTPTGETADTKQRDRSCSAAAKLGADASKVNLALEGSAMTLGVGAIAASPTGVGGGLLGIGAAGAAIGAKLASVVSIGAYGYDYLTTGNTTSLTGAGAGAISLFSSGIATRITGDVMRSGRAFGNLSAPQRARLGTAEAAYGSAAGAVENLVVETGC